MAPPPMAPPPRVQRKPTTQLPAGEGTVEDDHTCSASMRPIDTSSRDTMAGGCMLEVALDKLLSLFGSQLLHLENGNVNM